MLGLVSHLEPAHAGERVVAEEFHEDVLAGDECGSIPSKTADVLVDVHGPVIHRPSQALHRKDHR